VYTFLFLYHGLMMIRVKGRHYSYHLTVESATRSYFYLRLI